MCACVCGCVCKLCALTVSQAVQINVQAPAELNVTQPHMTHAGLHKRERGRERTNERKNALKPFARVESIGLKLLLVTEFAVSKGSTVLQTV